MTEEQTNSWVEEFDRQFPSGFRNIQDNKDYIEFSSFAVPVENVKDFISKTISQEKEKIIQEINKLESENWQDTYEAGFEDAKEIIINLLQNK